MYNTPSFLDQAKKFLKSDIPGETLQDVTQVLENQREYIEDRPSFYINKIWKYRDSNDNKLGILFKWLEPQFATLKRGWDSDYEGISNQGIPTSIEIKTFSPDALAQLGKTAKPKPNPFYQGINSLPERKYLTIFILSDPKEIQAISEHIKHTINFYLQPSINQQNEIVLGFIFQDKTFVPLEKITF